VYWGRRGSDRMVVVHVQSVPINISVISWRLVLLVEETGVHEENNRQTTRVIGAHHH
jgi:hypothetical protein